jgi:hypothetical protein
MPTGQYNRVKTFPRVLCHVCGIDVSALGIGYLKGHSHHGKDPARPWNELCSGSGQLAQNEVRGKKIRRES